MRHIPLVASAAILVASSSARAEFWAPPLPPSTYYEVGVFQMDSTVSFGKERVEPVMGIRFHERNGLMSKAMLAVAGGAMAAAIEPGDTVVTGIDHSTSLEQVDVVDDTGHKVGQTSALVETTTVHYRDKTEAERAADAAMMKQFNEGMGHFIGLPWSTEILLVPDNDDGKVHGGSFELTVSFGGQYWWIDMGLLGERWAMRDTDPETGMTVNHRYRNFSVPLRLTISPVAWLMADAEIRPNFLGGRDDKSDIDHSSSWRASVTVGLPYFEYVYARAGVQKTTILDDRPLGTFVELGARF